MRFQREVSGASHTRIDPRGDIAVPALIASLSACQNTIGKSRKNSAVSSERLSSKTEFLLENQLDIPIHFSE